MQPARIELLANEIDAEWRSSIPGTALSYAVLADGHVALVMSFRRAERVHKPVQSR